MKSHGERLTPGLRSALCLCLEHCDDLLVCTVIECLARADVCLDSRRQVLRSLTTVCQRQKVHIVGIKEKPNVLNITVSSSRVERRPAAVVTEREVNSVLNQPRGHVLASRGRRGVAHPKA